MKMQFNSFLELAMNRRSCRKFKPDRIPRETMRSIIDAGRWVPSAHNDQNTVSIWITDDEKKQRLRKQCNKLFKMTDDFDPFWGAPEVVAVLAKPTGDPSVSIMDGSLVMGNMILAAEAMGLGSCWVNSLQWNTEGVLDLTEDIMSMHGADEGPYIGVGILVLGYRDGECPKPLERKPMRIFEV